MCQERLAIEENRTLIIRQLPNLGIDLRADLIATKVGQRPTDHERPKCNGCLRYVDD
jgi:hypothetical protein